MLDTIYIKIGREQLAIPTAIGDSKPPQALAVFGTGNIRSVTVTPPPEKKKPVFWAPFTTLRWSFDFGWLGVYILAYLPPLFILRKVLRLP